jgi:hypothetical protein
MLFRMLRCVILVCLGVIMLQGNCLKVMMLEPRRGTRAHVWLMMSARLAHFDARQARLRVEGA